MADYSELKKAAAYAQDFDNFADEAEEMRALSQFYDEVDPAAVLVLIGENERLAAKIEQVRSRSVSLDYSKDAVIPNALDAWGRVVPQHLPYDFSGNPGASATQYCNGWNDAGGYWKAHCVDIQSERDQLKSENERLHKLISWQGDANNEVTISAGQLMRHMDERDQLKAENEALRKAVLAAREFIMHEAEVRGLLDENNEVSFRHPRRQAAIAIIDAAMGKGDQS